MLDKTPKTQSADEALTIAIEYAKIWHADQKYGTHPYVYHLQAVADALPREDFKTENDYKLGLAVAWLHDVLEDTEISPMKLEKSLPQIVCTAVQFLTDPLAPSRDIKKAMLYAGIVKAEESTNENIQSAIRLAKLVKCSDRYCNIRQSIDDDNQRKLTIYQQEHLEFTIIFSIPKSKVNQQLQALMTSSND